MYIIMRFLLVSQLKLDTSANSKEANTVKYIVETVAPKAEMDSKTTQ